MPLPLIRSDDLDATLAWRGGRPISRRQYLADVAVLAARLPPSGPMLNLSVDRYRFAVGLGAALLRGHSNLLPPNHTPDMLGRLQAQFGTLYCVADSSVARIDLPTVWHADGAADATTHAAVPAIDAEAVAAQVLTSGSTGAPLPHTKRWGLLVRNAQAGIERLARQMALPDLAGATLVATVPAQHMYGFESSVLVALLGGAAFDTERPFYPADIARALARVPRPRMLVTTPFHLKTLLDAGVALPPVDLLVCATAPLAPQLATRAEAELGAPLLEIYGCTEAGQVATRRTTAGAEWQVLRGLQLASHGGQVIVSGGHVPEPVALADVLELAGPTRFRLLGRCNDLINIAGKRSSLAHLNFHLNAIEGVSDGAFWLPPGSDAEVVRLSAFVVAPEVSQQHILGELRLRIDPAFLPRRIVRIAALPRDASGKLPAARLAQFAAQTAQAAQTTQAARSESSRSDV